MFYFGVALAFLLYSLSVQLSKDNAKREKFKFAKFIFLVLAIVFIIVGYQEINS